MRKLTIIAALAATTIASPALARDSGWYLGVEGGVIKPEDSKLDFDNSGDEFEDALKIDYKAGYDVDLIAGFDLGSFRAEAELGYKRSSVDDVRVNPQLFALPADVDFGGRARVLSAMANLLLDFGDDEGLGGYVGGGLGVARTKLSATFDGTGLPADTRFRGTDTGLAWQAIAGVALPVSDNVDIGLKYRFFNTKVDIEDEGQEIDGRFRSHSVLASLIFNFGGAAEAPLPPPPPPPPPPAPPAPPATQTCPDGSVILATEACPVPPPPPPPPPPEPVRG